MNEGGDNNCFIWENNEEWPFFNSNNNQVGSGEKFAGDKSLDPNRSNTCHQPLITDKETAKVTIIGKKRSAPNWKKDGNGSGTTKSGGDGDGDGDRERESDHEIHIMTERERRKKMRNMFSNLHALLPQLPPKADKSSIVDEAVKYIKALENTYEKLKQQKKEKLLLSFGNSREAFMADQGSTSNSAAVTPNSYNNNNILTGFQTWSSPNVILNICGEEAHISVCSPKKSGLFSTICYVLEKHKIHIVSAQLSSNHYRSMFMIQAQASGRNSLDQFSEALGVEEIYKQAASEIILWIASK